MSSFKFKLALGGHPEDLDDGQVLEPGAFVYLTEEQTKAPKAAQLIADERLLPTGPKGREQAADIQKETR